jgi:hypothetical protein
MKVLRKIPVLKWILPLSLAVTANAMQDTTTKTVNPNGQATVSTEVRSGEVVYVAGNELVVKLEDGSLKHFTVPENVTVNVDGKDLTVDQLKPGMKLTKTITTTTEPKLVTTVRTIKGKVWHANPPDSVILTLDDNTNKQYKVPKGQKFETSSGPRDVFALRKGMVITATVIKETPVVTQTEASNVTGSAPPPAAQPAPETPPEVGVLLIEEPMPAQAAPSEAPAQTEMAQANLPKTASSTPLVAFLGIVCVIASLTVRLCALKAARS